MSWLTSLRETIRSGNLITHVQKQHDVKSKTKMVTGTLAAGAVSLRQVTLTVQLLVSVRALAHNNNVTIAAAGEGGANLNHFLF